MTDTGDTSSRTAGVRRGPRSTASKKRGHKDPDKLTTMRLFFNRKFWRDVSIVVAWVYIDWRIRTRLTWAIKFICRSNLGLTGLESTLSLGIMNC